MHIHFEELSAPQRAGGIEAATRELAARLVLADVKVTRSAVGEGCDHPDCVHLHGIWSPQLAAKILSWRKKGVPCVITPHGMLEPWSLSHKWFKKKIAWQLYQKRLLQQAAVLHGTSKREVMQFRKLGLMPPTALVPWGISSPETIRNPQSAIRNPQVALFVGRIYPVKGLPMLIEAWAQIRPAGWKLKIVGPDEAGHRADVEALVQSNGLASVVEFAGELTGQAKATAYEEASLLVQPSYTENFGIAIAEALAAGVPVITTKGTPWEELVTRRCGWWVDINVEALAAALREAMALTNEQRQEMGERGRKLVEENYAWPKVAGDMKSVYEWVLGGGPKPGSVVD